jgi:hypothetical protein
MLLHEALELAGMTQKVLAAASLEPARQILGGPSSAGGSLVKYLLYASPTKKYQP